MRTGWDSRSYQNSHTRKGCYETIWFGNATPTTLLSMVRTAVTNVTPIAINTVFGGVSVGGLSQNMSTAQAYMAKARRPAIAGQIGGMNGVPAARADTHRKR